jgi:hypothetical protein
MKRLFYSKLEYLAIVRKEERESFYRRSQTPFTFPEHLFLAEHFGIAFAVFKSQPAGCGAVVRGYYPAGLLALESQNCQDGVAGRI